MAGVQSRFSLATENTIEELKNSSKNANTTKSTTFWFNVLTKWCRERQFSEKIEEYEPADLNNLLEQFYAEVKNKHGEDYEPDSLKIMLTALDRHLKDKGYAFSIVRDREFSSSKQVLDGKAKQLRLAGRGKRPNKARQVSNEEEEELWQSGKLGDGSPETLINTMWWLLTQHFGLRGRQEHHGMRMDDLHIARGEDGLEFVEFAEGPTKTRPGGLNFKHRQFQPRMFATGGQRCPVGLFRQYVSRRPINMQNTGPFYLSIKTNRRVDERTWYKVQPMGVNKINSMMKTIVAGTSLESSEKRFSNHSARKTLVNKMKKANLERSAIAKVTGHRSLQSLDDYDEADEQEQRDLSWAISKKNAHSSALATTSHQVNQDSAGPSFPSISSQAQNLMNSFHNCTVTFNLHNSKSPVIQPRKRRYAFLESDSD